MIATAPSFATRLTAAMARAAEVGAVFGSERRREILSLTIEGATVEEIRTFLEERHSIVLPKSAKRAVVVESLERVLGI